MMILNMFNIVSCLMHRSCIGRLVLGMGSVLWVLMLPVLVLAAVACGGAGDVSGDDGGGVVGDVPDGGGVVGDVPDGGGVVGDVPGDDGSSGVGFESDGSGEPERLVDYIGITVLSPDPEGEQAFYVRQEQRLEDLVAECMAMGALSMFLLCGLGLMLLTGEWSVMRSLYVNRDSALPHSLMLWGILMMSGVLVM